MRRHPPLPQARAQRGIVLFVALVVMVALSLAGVALIRAVDTTTTITGNLALRQASVLTSNWAVEDAAASLFADANLAAVARILDKTADDTTYAYYATLQAGESTGTVPAGIPRGIPAILHKKSGKASQWTDGALNQVRYVIERTCNATGPATVSSCDMLPPKQGLGTTIHDQTAPDLPRYPFYRVTIRVDGPQNTVSFVQAMLK